jgi:hypothetical protein
MVVRQLCTVTADLTPLKPFSMKYGARGVYYQVDYELGVAFAAELIFGIIHNGKVIGSAAAKYY